MKTALVFGLFLAVNVASAATLTCGDHWFKVSVTTTEGTGEATFSGDSNPDRGTISVTAKKGLISFQDKLGGSLRVDDRGDGYLKLTRNSDEESIFCR